VRVRVEGEAVAAEFGGDPEEAAVLERLACDTVEIQWRTSPRTGIAGQRAAACLTP